MTDTTEAPARGTHPSPPIFAPPTDEQKYQPPYQVIFAGAEWWVCDRWGNAVASAPNRQIAELLARAPGVADALGELLAEIADLDGETRQDLAPHTASARAALTAQVHHRETVGA